MTLPVQNQPVRNNDVRGRERLLSFPTCRVIQTSAQTIATATPTAIIFDSPNSTTIAWDTDAFYNPAASRTQVAIHTTGKFDAKVTVAFAASAAGANRSAWVYKNGDTSTRYAEASFTVVAAIAAIAVLNGVDTLNLTAGDYLELFVAQDSGGNLSTTSQGGIAPMADIKLSLLTL